MPDGTSFDTQREDFDIARPAPKSRIPQSTDTAQIAVNFPDAEHVRREVGLPPRGDRAPLPWDSGFRNPPYRDEYIERPGMDRGGLYIAACLFIWSLMLLGAGFGMGYWLTH